MNKPNLMKQDPELFQHTIVHVRMDCFTWEKLRRAADRHNTSLSKIIRHLIRESC